MTGLHQRVRRTIQRHALCPSGARVLVAVSGGSDSVALTLILRDLAEYGGFVVAALAHFNHRLRDTAERDEQFCRDFAARLDLPLWAESVDVAEYAASHRLSIEQAARRVRYAFLHRAAADAGADRIAVGHTRDDQAETFLLKLIRGAGLAALGGIYPRKGIVVRPLLELSRTELRAYLAESGQLWVEDESNADIDNPRNRIRHRVIPELDRAYGGPTSIAIARSATVARQDGEWLDEVSSRRYDALVARTPDGLRMDAVAVAAEPPPVRRRVLLRAMRAMAGEREVGLDHVEAALGVLEGSCRGADVPGSRVELRRGKLVLIRAGLTSEVR